MVAAAMVVAVVCGGGGGGVGGGDHDKTEMPPLMIFHADSIPLGILDVSNCISKMDILALLI